MYLITVGKIRQVIGHDPVQCDVGEWCLGAPTGWGIDTIDKGLDALLDLTIGQIVHLDKGGQIGVKARESLCARPFVLHDAQEVDHLVA